MITDGQPLVCAQSLGYRVGARHILREVDLAVSPGDRIAVTGRSGSGKTTLLLALAGLLSPSAGAVTWPALDQGPRTPRGQVGIVFQAPSLMPELTARENVMLPLRLAGTGVDEARCAALNALALVGGADLAEAVPAQLSGGQQQRVAVALALAGRHRLVLADEPTGALDRELAHQVSRALLDGVARSGGALLLATHDPELAALLDRRLVLSDGQLLRGMPR
jgi:ABC-type lipoprotein export system ATPase subunit